MNFLMPGGVRASRSVKTTLPALLGMVAGACTFNPDDRCGPHENIYGNNDVCVCEEGAALTASGCVPCAEHEVPGADGCVCADGYSRPVANAACELAPVALGAACSTDAPCADASYNHCQPAANGTAYCTNTGCASSNDCSDGYGCDANASPTVCMRPPSGLGKACMSATDCADGEATYCESFMTHQCLVQDCTLSPDNCFPGWVCMDLSTFGLPNLCVPPGAM